MIGLCTKSWTRSVESNEAAGGGVVGYGGKDLRFLRPIYTNVVKPSFANVAYHPVACLGPRVGRKVQVTNGARHIVSHFQRSKFTYSLTIFD